MCEEKLEIKIADEIKHLSPNEIEELYQKYLEGEKNSVLVKDYKIDINPNKLIKILPPKKLDDTLCPYCGIPMFVKRKRKSYTRFDVIPIECSSCNHKVFSEEFRYRHQQCECKNCVIKRRQQKIEEEKKKRKVIRDLYNIDDRNPIDYSDLTFSHKLVLLTLFKMQTNEEFGSILSLDDPSRTESLSPTELMDVECLEDLFSCGVVIIDPDSRIDAFVEDKGFKSPNINRVRWIPNVALDGVNRSRLDDVFDEIYNELKRGIKSEWEKDIHEILFRIPREEVLQYIHVKSDEIGVHFSAEKKTREIVNQLLHNFSVSEIYYFAKKSVEDAHIYYVKGRAKSKKHAANIIPNKMLSLGERALNEGWNTYKFSRDSRAPRSYISKVFYDFFLQDEDAVFYKSPGRYWEQELRPRWFCKNKGGREGELFCPNCKSEDLTFRMIDDYLEISCKDCGSLEKFTSSK